VLLWLLRRQGWVRSPGVWWHGALAVLTGALASAVVLAAASLVRWPLLNPAILLVVALRPIMDWLALSGAWAQLGPEFRSGRWDQLRLTGKTEGGLLLIHEAAAHAHLWRALWAVLGAQTAALALAALWLAGQPLGGQRAQILGGAGLLALLLGVELWLRVRALTMVGLALSASLPRAGGAALAGGLALLLLWLVQSALVLLGLMFASIAAVLIDPFTGGTGSLLFLLLFPALWVLAAHRFVRRMALHRLVRSVARRSETL
jgi:hypothetical protein